VRCADHRAKTALTDHDGQLEPATVEEVFPAAKLQRLSPSRLKGYAQCGFAYYLNRGLGLSAPDDISPEPDNLVLGDFIHDTLELFYTRLQDQPGEPVNLTDYDRPTLEQKLLTAAADVEATLELPYESAFYTTWKSHLFAGLADPDKNDHCDPETTAQPAPEAAHSQQDRGFFVRFLEQEYERETDLRPAWFETAVGFDEPAETLDLSLPNETTVTLSGRVDRVDIAPDSTAKPGSIFDYKTGSTNLARTVDGVEFQLPLYALAARRGIAAATDADPAELTVDAHFYDIDVPGGASWKGPLSERVGDSPTDPAYTAFLDDLTLQRVQQIHDGITEGAFHPSVLGADEAGCKHCDYHDVCDVRHHGRYDVIEHIDATDATAYVADRARERAVTDRLPGGDAE
jgi:ATP-dependent helicase/nuclease subunit B